MCFATVVISCKSALNLILKALEYYSAKDRIMDRPATSNTRSCKKCLYQRSTNPEYRDGPTLYCYTKISRWQISFFAEYLLKNKKNPTKTWKNTFDNPKLLEVLPFFCYIIFLINRKYLCNNYIIILTIISFFIFLLWLL